MRPSSDKFKGADIFTYIPGKLVMENGRPKVGTMTKEDGTEVACVYHSQPTALNKDGTPAKKQPEPTASRGTYLNMVMRNDVDNGEKKQALPGFRYGYGRNPDGTENREQWGQQGTWYTAKQINALFDAWTPTTVVSQKGNDLPVLYGKGTVMGDDYHQNKGGKNNVEPNKYAFKVNTKDGLSASDQPLDYEAHKVETRIAQIERAAAKEAKKSAELAKAVELVKAAGLINDIPEIPEASEVEAVEELSA